MNFKLIIPFFALAIGCASSTVQVHKPDADQAPSSASGKVLIIKPEGDQAQLKLQQGKALTVELLAVTDTHLYFLQQKQIHRILLENVQKIKIQEPYRGVTKVGKFILLLPAYFFEYRVFRYAIERDDVRDRSAWIAGVAFVLTARSNFSGFPKVAFAKPLDRKDIEALKLHCRYPQGLSTEQWKSLLRHSGQDDFQS